jgi:phage-related protein (TIGR01555 family)
MGAITYLGDRLQNLVANIGTGRDKAAASVYGLPVLGDGELLSAYRGSWLPRKIVDIPAHDACRKWRDWQAEAEQISRIEAEEKRLQLRAKTRRALIMARLYGGAALFIGTGDTRQDEPLDLNRIGTGGLRYVTALSRLQLSAGEIDKDPASEWFNRPAFYTLTGVRTKGTTSALSLPAKA